MRTISVMAVIPFLFFLLLAPWPDQHSNQAPGQGIHDVGSVSLQKANYSSSKVASAQGLRASEESLGASESAGLGSFNEFEDLLDLSDDFTGGRGGRNRRPGGGRNNRNGGPYENEQTLRQLQLELYHVAGSPMVYHSFNTSQTPGGKNYLPTVRDQKNCDTCVAHAVAATATASVASALRDDATNWDIDPQSLYYCSGGGRACKSGWQIEEALFTLEDTPELVRPTNCLLRGNEEPEIRDWRRLCQQAIDTCPKDDRSRPWLSCTFRALSSFWQIQQSIRQHGAVVTRITIYDDFPTFFDPSRTGLENEIYTRRANAAKLYGHAAAIVGYDNVNKAWTMLNSWGNRSTSDGLFRIAMGEAGVGAPDDTYEIVCEPEPGTDLDPHELQTWKRAQRKSVTLVNPDDRLNLDAQCYNYQAVPGDTASSIAAAFQIDIRGFAQQNTQVFTPVEVSTNFNTSLTAQQVTAILANIEALQTIPGAPDPYFRCTSDAGIISECRLGGPVEPCTGVVNCTVLYQEPDVAHDPAGQVLRICNISTTIGEFEAVAKFDDPAVSQPRALSRLLQAFGLDSARLPRNICGSNSRNWQGVPRAQCDGRWVTDIDLATSLEPNALLNRNLVELLLTLERLRTLRIFVASGSTIPPQLGGLQSLQDLSARSPCWDGQLPNNAGRGWPDISRIDIAHEGQERPDCGIVGSLPDAWGASMTKLTFLQLSAQRLSGSLPSTYSKMAAMQQVLLSDNQLTGTLPSSYSNWTSVRRVNLGNNNLEGFLPRSYGAWDSITHFNLSDNDFQGEVPAAWIRLRDTLEQLTLSNNERLEGCIPLSNTTTVRSNGTQLTDLCSPPGIAQQQAAAIRTELRRVLGGAWRPVVDLVQEVDSADRSLSNVWAGEDGKDTNTVRFNGGQGYVSRTLSIINSLVYLTTIEAEGAFLNTTFLPGLVSRLPRLEAFHCFRCNKRINQELAQLPPLADSAPRTLKSLKLEGSRLTGTLLDDWSRWSSLETLSLKGNNLRGRLPVSWRAMRSLRTLDLSDNPGLTGSIPALWGAMRANIFLHGTSITGCIPVTLINRVFWDKPKEPCGQVVSDAEWLIRIRRLLDQSGVVLGSWSEENSRKGVAGHCQTFEGVRCGELNEVVSINLPELDKRGLQATGVQITEVLQIISNFESLQVLNLTGNRAIFEGSELQPEPFLSLASLAHLDLSDCGLSGSFPASLATALPLQHVNFSGNPGLSGSLPELWGRLSQLTEIDLTGCGVNGPLPRSWASMQELRVFKAGDNRPGVSGQLPESWGLLGSLEVLDITGAQLTGTLPAVWADSTALAARSGAIMAQAMRQIASESASAASDDVVARMQQVMAKRARLGMLKVQELRLPGNQLSGPLPGAWAAMRGLQVLDLSSNQLSSALPENWVALRKLLKLSLSNNPLGGTLPPTWGGMTSIQQLDLNSCRLQGRLPALWSGMREVVNIDLGNNRLTGGLPAEWGIMRFRDTHKLETLNLANNPCMNAAELVASIRESMIQANEQVAVTITGVGGGGPDCSK